MPRERPRLGGSRHTISVVIPATFTCTTTRKTWEQELVVAAALDLPAVQAILEAIDAVDWPALSHAYHAATDTPAHLVAVAVGDERCRDLAWDELWGTIHHQGTVYSATVEAVPIFAAVARWQDYPNRAMALVYLRAIAVGDGDDAAAVRQAVHEQVPRLMADEHKQPQDVRRALVWLLTAFPDHATFYGDLPGRLLPAEHRPTWTSMLAAAPAYWPDSDAQYDAYCDFEGWATDLAYQGLAGDTGHSR
jgi:hypothetical protein